jgi:uncharacterized protein YhhL (DUF1145 family)
VFVLLNIVLPYVSPSLWLFALIALELLLLVVASLLLLRVNTCLRSLKAALPQSLQQLEKLNHLLEQAAWKLEHGSTRFLHFDEWVWLLGGRAQWLAPVLRQVFSKLASL